MYAIHMDNVLFAYSQIAGQRAHRGPLLRDFTMEFRPGEVVALMGPSGCGKSTILNLIAGYLKPRAGSIHCCDRLVSSPGRDRVVLAQDGALFPWLDVSGNVEFGLKRDPRWRAGTTARALNALEVVGLLDHAAAYPHELSAGQRQRAALARAIAVEPPVLLLDEPTASLDPERRWELEDYLKKIFHQYHPTVVIATHDVDQACFLASRVVIVSGRPLSVTFDYSLSDSERASASSRLSADFLRLRTSILDQLVRSSGHYEGGGK